MLHSSPSEPVSATSTTLLQQLQANSAEGWRRLVEIYGPVVYRWCRRRGLNNEDAADIVQEVFRSVTLAFERFRRDRPSDSFRSWLVTITQNKVRDFFRRSSTQPTLMNGSDVQAQLANIAAPSSATSTIDDSQDDSGIHELPDDRQLVLQGTLQVLKQQIEEKTWLIFWRTTVDGHSAADIAKEFGMTSKAVRQAKYRVLQRLREELAELDAESIGA